MPYTVGRMCVGGAKFGRSWSFEAPRRTLANWAELRQMWADMDPRRSLRAPRMFRSCRKAAPGAEVRPQLGEFRPS